MQILVCNVTLLLLVTMHLIAIAIAIAVNESTRGNRWRRRAPFIGLPKVFGLRSSVFDLPYARQLQVASAAGIDLHIIVVGLSQIQI